MCATVRWQLSVVEQKGNVMALPHQSSAPEAEAFYGRLVESLTLQKVDGEQGARMDRIRDDAKSLALTIASQCPSGRERALAATHLEETVMWAIKAVALDQPSS